jgi:flagellin-specific chaperone FliS
MRSLDAYKSNDAMRWARIDMLLALYEGTLQQLRLTIQAVTARDQVRATTHRTRAAALVTTIRSGIAPEHGEIAIRIDQLCEFVQHALLEGDVDRLRSAERVLQDIHSAFLQIRDEARRLEAEGVIPPLPQEATIDASV